MRRWKTFFEIVLLPLKVLVVGFILLGLGEMLINENFALFYTITNQYILILARLLILIGRFIIANFPILLVLKFVSKRTHSSSTIIMGLVGYVVFLITTMLFAPTTLTATSYSNILGISYSAINTATGIMITRHPIQTGILGSFIVGFCTHMAYHNSRGKQSYGLFAFVDKNTFGIILNILFCIIAGIIVALGWQYLDNYVQKIINFIANDITNPINMFLYGIFDRLFSIGFVGESLRQPFWYTAVGGSWNNITGEAVLGDVNIWTKVVNQGQSALSYGRFITPYYVLNIFAIPGLLLGMFTIYTDKIQRNRLVVFLIILIVISVLTGTLLPLELFLLFLCPLLLLFHVLYTGLLFGVFEYAHAYLGFKFSGDVVTALPGKFIDYVVFIRSVEYFRTLRIILIVGVISFVVYFFMTRIYFKFLALDLFDLGKKKKITEGFTEAIGGIENIKMINASPYRLIVQIVDIDKIDLIKLQKLGATKVSRTRAGLAFSFGSSSYMIKRLLDKKISENKRIIE
jgi:phosphotransferase system  glucose/maltose/N-acetylglucosamine-specific IIC component